MDHLADCSSCRELVRLTSPRIDFGVHNGQYFRPERNAFPVPAVHDWHGLRWGALAAVAMIVVSVVRYRTAKQSNVPVAPNAAVIQPLFSSRETMSSHLAVPNASPVRASNAPSNPQKSRDSASSGGRSISRGQPTRIDKVNSMAGATARNQSRLASGSGKPGMPAMKSPALI